MRKRVKKLLHNDEKCVTIKALYVNLLLGGIRIMATFYASKTGEVSAREKEHSALVRELAGECMTLLENDGTLPLAGAGKVAVYGNGVRHTVKGGTGSGRTSWLFCMEERFSRKFRNLLTRVLNNGRLRALKNCLILGCKRSMRESTISSDTRISSK